METPQQRKHRYRAYRAQGLCGNCGGTRSDPKSLCEKCRNKSNKRLMKKYYDHKAKGLCVACPKAATIGTLCGRCHDIRHRTRSERSKLGLCIRHKIPTPAAKGYLSCKKCLAASKVHYQTKREKALNSGKCLKCHVNSTMNTVYCKICTRKRNDDGRELANMRKASGLCGCGAERKYIQYKMCGKCRRKAADYLYEYRQRPRNILRHRTIQRLKGSNG